MNCPKCGYERQDRDDAFVPPGECPACGLVYSKHDPAKEPTEVVHRVPPPQHRPSPVDALSLRKARERVEKRLREQVGTRIKDDRHAQTLELAKRLTAEQVRKRQDEWKQTHTDKQVSLPEADQEAADDPNMESVELIGADQSPAPDEVPQGQIDDGSDQATEEAADEITPSAEAAPQEPDGAPASAMDNPLESMEDMEMDAEGGFEGDEEAAPDDETELVATDEPLMAMEAGTPTAMAAPQTDTATASPEIQEALPPAHAAAEKSARRGPTGSGGGIARLLPVVAWLILAAGVIGAILSWITIGGVEPGAVISTENGLHSLPLGLLLGFAYLATGVLGFAFFWVSSLISTQLKDIYRMLLSGGHPENSLQDEAV
jgi:hypothetical protein